MTDYRIGVVAHVDRRDEIAHLAKSVNPYIIEVDDGRVGSGGNHLQTIETMFRDHPDKWLVIMEDDAEPVDGFNEQVELALDVAPSPLVSFYLGTGYPAQYQARFAEAVTEDACWIMHAQLRHAVCYAIAPGYAKGLLARMPKLVRERFAADDAISRWAMENRISTAYTNPSLVDHKDGPTVITYRMHLGHAVSPGRKRPRKAHKVGTRRTWLDTRVLV